MFSFTGEDEFDQGRIVSRAGKATGKHKNWVILECQKPDHLAGSTGAIDLSSSVTTWEEIEDDLCLLTETKLHGDYHDAKLDELESWRFFKVFTEVQMKNQPYLETRWVCILKEGGQKKARLVARGFQDPANNVRVKDSSTCSREFLRVLLAMFTSQQGWETGFLDVKTAFLQGSELNREVFVLPPFETQKVRLLWKLKKAVYGLSDAPRKWFDRVVKELVLSGCNLSKFDICVFYLTNNRVCEGVLTVHVDVFGGPALEFSKSQWSII